MMRPDIVLLVLDTQRRDRLSCYGHTQPTTPHLDRLAADATRFNAAFSTAQWTIPSHASMFTGLYPAAHTTQQSFSVLPPSIPTLAERLRDSGYFTAAFCNNPLVGVVNNGLRRGFYSFLNYSGLLTSHPNQAGARRNIVDRYRQFFKRTVSALLTRIQDSFARSELLLAISFTPLMVPLWQTALSFKGNTARSLGDAARMLIDRRGLEQGQPAFAFINLMGTHTPYQAHPRYLERFAPHVLHNVNARRFIRRFNNDIFGWLSPLAGEIDAERKAALDGVYNAETAAQDDLVGTFIERLRGSGRLDKTLFIVCADHGEHLGEKQFMGHNYTAYNELVHVPLIVRDPLGEVPYASINEQVVSTRRIFHTVLASAGLADDHERALTLASNSDADGGTVFAEALPVENVVNMVRRRRPDLLTRHLCDQPRRAVVQGRYKFIQTGEHIVELYDRLNDPSELVNLAVVLPEQADEMQEQIDSYRQQMTAQAPAVNRAAEDDPTVRKRLHDLGYLE
jgi:arylsulfatase A-like enzyme